MLGKRCSACWQERKAVVGVEPQPESYSGNKRQHITLVVRDTSQKSQTKVVVVFSLRRWDLGKNLTSWYPTLTLVLSRQPYLPPSLHIHHTHTRPSSLSGP